MWAVIENEYAKDKRIGYAELETVDRDDGDILELQLKDSGEPVLAMMIAE